jgi:hypothetical protein
MKGKIAQRLPTKCRHLRRRSTNSPARDSMRFVAAVEDARYAIVGLGSVADRDPGRRLDAPAPGLEGGTAACELPAVSGRKSLRARSYEPFP